MAAVSWCHHYSYIWERMHVSYYYLDVTRFVNRGFHNHLNSLLPTSIQWQIQEAAMVSAETHIERVHFCSENGHEV